VLSERLALVEPRPNAPRPQVRPPSPPARPVAPRPVAARPSSIPASRRATTQPNMTRPTPLTLKPSSEAKPVRASAGNGHGKTEAISVRGGMPQATPVPARPRPMGRSAQVPSAARALEPRAASASRTALVVQQAKTDPLSVAVYSGVTWVKDRSIGFKFRMVALTMLFVWLCGITAPVAVLSALNSPQAGAIQIAGIAVNLGDSAGANPAGAIATFTPTALAASGSQRNAPQVVANAAVVAQKTPTRAAVRVGQPTPAQGSQGLNPVPADALQPTATPNVEYKLVKVRQLTPCENSGNHHIFALVLDANGKGIPNVEVEFIWDSGSIKDHTGQKNENIPALGVNSQTTAGYVNWPIFKGRTRVRVSSGPSEMTDWLRVDLPDQRCDATENSIGNSLFHYSYLVVFQKVR